MIRKRSCDRGKGPSPSNHKELVTTRRDHLARTSSKHGPHSRGPDYKLLIFALGSQPFVERTTVRNTTPAPSKATPRPNDRENEISRSQRGEVPHRWPHDGPPRDQRQHTPTFRHVSHSEIIPGGPLRRFRSCCRHDGRDHDRRDGICAYVRSALSHWL